MLNADQFKQFAKIVKDKHDAVNERLAIVEADVRKRQIELWLDPLLTRLLLGTAVRSEPVLKIPVAGSLSDYCGVLRYAEGALRGQRNELDEELSLEDRGEILQWVFESPKAYYRVEAMLDDKGYHHSIYHSIFRDWFCIDIPC